MADRNMMLTLDEYMDLRRLLSSEKESEGAVLEERLVKSKPKRKTTKYQKELGRQLEKQNQLKRKKNGQLKKGQTSASILSSAHKATRKALK